MASKVLFYIGILCELTVSFSGMAFGDYKENWFIALGIAAFAGSILLDLEIKKMWPWYLAGALIAVVFYYYQRQALILRIVLPILAGRKQSVRNVVKIFFWGTLIVTVIKGILSIFGVGGELYLAETFRHNVEIRYKFGFLHPNAFSLFWFRIFIMGMYAYLPVGEKTRIAKPIGYILAALFLVPLYLAKSKTGLILGVAVYVAFLLAEIIRWGGTRKILFHAGNFLMLMEIWFVYSCMIWLFPTQDGNNRIWWIINNLTTGRSHLTHTLYQTYEPPWMGIALGSDASEVGFVNALYNQGLIFIILYVCALFYIFYRMYKQKSTEGMLLILGITFYAMSEAFLPYFNKNSVFLLFIGLAGSGLVKREADDSENTIVKNNSQKENQK